MIFGRTVRFAATVAIVAIFWTALRVHADEPAPGDKENATPAAADAPANPFPDARLEAVIREILKKKQIEKPAIEDADLKTIYFLEAPQRGIQDLTGLEKCTNLASISLPDNEIEKLEPLAGLKNVQTLTLSRNKIADLTPLAGLVKLQLLDVADNQIEKIEALSGMGNLRDFWAARNHISDLSPLSGLSKLQSLDVDENQVGSLAVVKDLKWLSTLRVRKNKVEDLAPLADLTDLRYTFLEGNPLKSLGPLVEMAKKDVEGEQRFAPYWNVFVDVAALPEEARAQVEALQGLGVRINPPAK